MTVDVRDGDKLVAALREAADQIETAQLALDRMGVPRALPGDEIETPLAGRIAMLMSRLARWYES